MLPGCLSILGLMTGWGKKTGDPQIAAQTKDSAERVLCLQEPETGDRSLALVVGPIEPQEGA